MMFNEDDFEKKISFRFIKTLNRHLPFKRKTLKELLHEDRPSIRNRDNSVHSFDKKELLKLAEMTSDWDHDRLRLPIYLEMSSSMERGTIRISGRIESSIIGKILYEGEEKAKLDDKDSRIIYYPHLATIRKELPTTTQFMFTI